MQVFTCEIQYLWKLIQHHLLLGFSIWRVWKQLLLRIRLIQVLTGDLGLIDHFTRRCLQRWDKTKRVLLKEPVRFVCQVDVDDIMPTTQRLHRVFKARITGMFTFYTMNGFLRIQSFEISLLDPFSIQH